MKCWDVRENETSWSRNLCKQLMMVSKQNEEESKEREEGKIKQSDLDLESWW